SACFAANATFACSSDSWRSHLQLSWKVAKQSSIALPPCATRSAVTRGRRHGACACYAPTSFRALKMQTNTTRISLRLLASAATCAVLATACSKGANNQTQTANGSLDTGSVRTGADVPAEGPGVQVTRTDGKSVTRSTKYELTTDNFTHFVAAADSLSA